MRRSRRRSIRFGRIDIREVDEATLILNLYITQGLILAAAVALILLGGIGWREMFVPLPGAGVTVVTYGILFAALVLCLEGLISWILPEEFADVGGVNEKLFRNRSLPHIAVICLVVATCEELLFRGAVQHFIGAYWTSVLFAAIHVRYLRSGLMTLAVFAISYGLGWIYDRTGTLLTPIIAHFTVDFALGYIIARREKFDG